MILLCIEEDKEIQLINDLSVLDPLQPFLPVVQCHLDHLLLHYRF